MRRVYSLTIRTVELIALMYMIMITMITAMILDLQWKNDLSHWKLDLDRGKNCTLLS